MLHNLPCPLQLDVHSPAAGRRLKEKLMFEKIFRNRSGGQGQGRGQGGPGRGRGGGNAPGSGPGGDCVCPKCGQRVQHTAGQRCMDMNCPKCGTKMIKE